MLHVKHLHYILSILFLFIASSQYSWLPNFILLPLLLLFSSIYIIIKKINLFSIFFLSLSIFLLYISSHTQTQHSEYLRNILLMLFFPVSYYIFRIHATNSKKFINLLTYIFLGSNIVVFYVFFISMPQDPSEFFGERRGYHAMMHLFFGEPIEGTIGVTHLNIYIMFILTYIMMLFVLDLTKYKIYWKAYFVFIFLLMLLTQSRSPIVYLVITFVILLFHYDIFKKYKISSLFLLTIVLIAGYYTYEANIVQNSERIGDVSRLFFWGKGIEHLMEEPWGNSLIYTDTEMLLQNYHNTFLGLGNRASLAFLILLILYAITIYRNISLIVDIKQKTSLHLLMYFIIHNFMIENILLMEYFVLIIFIGVLPYTTNLIRIQGYKGKIYEKN